MSSDFVTVVVDLNNEQSINDIMDRIVRLERTSPDDAKTAVYRFRTSDGKLANILAGPVGFSNMLSTQAADKFEATHCTLTKRSHANLTKLLRALAYVAQVTDETRSIEMAPLRTVTLEDGSEIATFETRNLAPPGTTAYGVRKNKMDQALRLFRLGAASYLATSALRVGLDGRFWPEWSHDNYSKAGRPASLAPATRVPPIAAEDDSEELSHSKSRRRTGALAAAAGEPAEESA